MENRKQKETVKSFEYYIVLMFFVLLHDCRRHRNKEINCTKRIDVRVNCLEMTIIEQYKTKYV